MVLSDNPEGWRKYFIAGWAFVECLLFAGILYGWSSLVFVLKDEGIYADLCSSDTTSNSSLNNTELIFNDTKVFTANYLDTFIGVNEKEVYSLSGNFSFGYKEINETLNSDKANDRRDIDATCKPQDSRMALCFTLSSAIFCASCFFMGHINYKLGTRITRLIAIVIFIAGSLCLAFVNKDVPWLMYPGLTLIGVGGLPLLVTNTQVSNMFTKGSSSVVGLLCGGYDMSSAVFLVIKLAYQNGVSRQIMYVGLAALQLMTLVSTFAFLPRGFIERKIMPQTLEVRLNSIADTGEGLLGKKQLSRRPSIADIQPLSSYLRQPLFITHNIWICLLQLRFYYLIGSLNTYLNRTLNGDKHMVSYFTNVCFYTMMGGLVTSFFAGIVYDWQKKIFSAKHHSKLYRSIMPAIFPLSVASLLSILFSILVLVPAQWLLYVIFIIMTLNRSFLYSMAAAFISAIFPSQYFGLLYGITILSAGIFGCLQYAFFQLAESYELGPHHADIGLLCVAILSLGHPIYMWICAKRDDKDYKASLQ